MKMKTNYSCPFSLHCMLQHKVEYKQLYRRSSSYTLRIQFVLWHGRLGFGQKNRVQFPAAFVVFSRRSTQPPIQCRRGFFYLEIKPEGRETGRFNGAKVKNEYCCTYTPPTCLHGVERDNFTLTWWWWR
jgi:hypothetical protein